MTRTRFYRPVPRWRPGLAAALALVACWSPSASGTVTNTPLHAAAAFSAAGEPVDVFATPAGLYELDARSGYVRFWQRSDKGLELVLPAGGTAFEPRTAVQIQNETPRSRRFQGKTAGGGTVFNNPKGLAKHPSENKFAVVNGGSFLAGGNLPSVQVYSFAETPADGPLQSLEISFEQEFHEAFHTTTNGMELVFKGYTNVVSVATSNVVLGVSSNWVYVVEATEDGHATQVEVNIWDEAVLPENADIASSGTDVRFRDERYVYFSSSGESGSSGVDWSGGDGDGSGYAVTGYVAPTNLFLLTGDEYPLRTWFVQVISNATVTVEPVYERRPTNISTNTSYLASATDVAFLGDAGFVVPISDWGYYTVYNDKRWDTDHWVTNVHEVSAFVVFDASDPSRQASVFACATNLPGKIAGIDVDPATGDIYAAVPSAAAVYRYKSPGGTPASWLTLPDRTIVTQDLAFAAGLPGTASDEFGYLSNPQDVSIWLPGDGTTNLLVSDRNNGRVMAFDPGVLSWYPTNWLGASYVPARDANGALVDPAVGFIVSTNTGYRIKYEGLEQVRVPVTSVQTNWFRVDPVAFPLFAVADTANPMNNPGGVFGQNGANVLAVADTGGGAVRLFAVDLLQLDSPDIRSMAVWWPEDGSGFPELSTRDFAVATNDEGQVVVCWDAPHANPLAMPFFTVVEKDGATNVLSFTVDLARSDRTYELSIAPADGRLPVLCGTATVPAGDTRGSFAFAALDGVQRVWTNVVWWATNASPEGIVVRTPAEEGAPDAAFAETNVWRTSPLYTATIACGSYSTNAAIVAVNQAPVVTNACFYGWVEPGDPEFNIPAVIFVYGLGVAATDVAADGGLRYLWWATTNRNWAANNLDWAVTNNDWAATATAEWSYFNGDAPAELVVTNWVDYATDLWDDYDGLPHYYTVTTNYASFFAEQTQTGVSGAVVNGIDLYVARGVGMPLPFRYNVYGGPYAGYEGLTPGASWGTAPFVVVCTVLDKDGGATVVSFPQKAGPADYDAQWTWTGDNLYYGMSRGISGDEVSDAVYAAVFTAVSETNVTFEVRLVSGTQAGSDKVNLESATTVTGAWETLDDVPVGLWDFSSGAVPHTISPAGSGPVRFYRIVQP